MNLWRTSLQDRKGYIMENNKSIYRNGYTTLIYDLYDVVRFGEDKSEETSKKKKPFWKKKQKNTKLEEQLERIEKKKEAILKTIPSFYDLWDFCEFVRIMEKVFFFPNSSSDILSVEFDMSGKSKEAKFRIKKKSVYEIRFVLTKSDLPFPAVSNKIEITVVRDYGLKMRNSYTIINGKTNYEDNSDLYLINEINFLLKRTIYNTFSQVIELIMKEISCKEKSEEEKNYELYEQCGFNG